jgi:hypothetical protein
MVEVYNDDVDAPRSACVLIQCEYPSGCDGGASCDESLCSCPAAEFYMADMLDDACTRYKQCVDYIWEEPPGGSCLCSNEGVVPSSDQCPELANIDQPTAAPTAAPTRSPTGAPTRPPTVATEAPTPAPTADPTAAPTGAPSPPPSAAPTTSPTATPYSYVVVPLAGTREVTVEGVGVDNFPPDLSSWFYFQHVVFVGLYAFLALRVFVQVRPRERACERT